MDAITVGVMQGLTPEAAALSVQIKDNVKLAQTLGACGFAVCLWDTLAYLHIEYNVVWKAKWSFMKATYVFTRYITLSTGILYFIGFFASFSPSTCKNYVMVFPAIGTLPLLGCTLMLVARAYKIWDDNKVLLWTMLFFTGAQLTGQLAVTLVQTIPVPIGIGVKACIPTTKGSIFVIYWIFPLAAHLFLTLFIFIKSWQLSASSSGFTTFARIQAVIFTRNGLVFPICVVLVEIAQIIFSLVVEDMQRAILSPLSSFLISILCCQMVLIYRLTDKNGMLGYGICHNSKTNPFDNSKGAHPSMPTFGGVTSISRLGGVRAIVTSHQAVDDEKMYGKGAGSSAHSSASHGSTQAYANKQSVVNIVPNVPKNSGPFSSSPVKGHTDGDLSDAESISDEDLKSFPQTKATSRAL